MCLQIEMGYALLILRKLPIEDSYGTTGRSRISGEWVLAMRKSWLNMACTPWEMWARCSTGASSDFYNEDLLYKLFGVNADFLLTMPGDGNLVPSKPSKLTDRNPQALDPVRCYNTHTPMKKPGIVVREMADALSLDLFSRHFVTDQLVLTIGYDIDNLSDPARRSAYHGEVTTDRYGRKVPKHGHGTIHLADFTSSSAEIIEAAMTLYDRNHIACSADPPPELKCQSCDT